MVLASLVIGYFMLGIVAAILFYLYDANVENDICVLFPVAVCWPFLLLILVGYWFTRPIVHLRKRIHKKKETLSKENMPSSPPKAGTLWEEEKEEKKKVSESFAAIGSSQEITHDRSLARLPRSQESLIRKVYPFF